MPFSARYLGAPVLALLLTGPASAQTTQTGTSGERSGAFPRSGNFDPPLYRDADVARSLSLSEQQLKRLNDATAQLQSTYRSQLGKLGSLSERERLARTNALLDEYNTALDRSVAGILNERQMNRYRQLHLQSRGLEAFKDPAVQRRLKLTSQQRQKIEDLHVLTQKQVDELRQAARTNRDEAVRRYQAARQRWYEQANTILDRDQRRMWRDMSGEGFNFRPSFTSPGREIP